MGHYLLLLFFCCHILLKQTSCIGGTSASSIQWKLLDQYFHICSSDFLCWQPHTLLLWECAFLLAIKIRTWNLKGLPIRWPKTSDQTNSRTAKSSSICSNVVVVCCSCLFVCVQVEKFFKWGGGQISCSYILRLPLFVINDPLQRSYCATASSWSFFLSKAFQSSSSLSPEGHVHHTLSLKHAIKMLYLYHFNMASKPTTFPKKFQKNVLRLCFLIVQSSRITFGSLKSKLFWAKSDYWKGYLIFTFLFFSFL